MDRESWSAAAGARGPGCEPVSDGLLAEPVAAVTSLAFVAAGALILRRARRSAAGAATEQCANRPRTTATTLTFPALVAGIGVGSVVQHGFDPAWSDVVHDLPLLATLAFVAADGIGRRVGRSPAWWWWALPTAVLLPVVVLAPRLGDLAQVGVAVVAVGVTCLRAVDRPELRARIGSAVGLLALGATLGTLSRAGWPLCDPASPWQGHGAWHVLAAAALTVLAPVLGRDHADDGDPLHGDYADHGDPAVR